MAASAGASEVKHSKTGMTHAEMKEFIRNHFEEFVNRKNLRIGEVNFAPGFVDHGADVPAGLPPGPAGAMQYVDAALKKVPDLRVAIEDMIAEAAGAMQYVDAALKKVPDLRVAIEDMIAEDDKVAVRNHWTGRAPMRHRSSGWNFPES